MPEGYRPSPSTPGGRGSCGGKAAYRKFSARYRAWKGLRCRETRFRVKAEKTASARRWVVAVPDWLMDEIAKTCPREDRTPGRRVFQGFSPDVAKNVMARACKAAGIAHRHPHDLRHRYASVKIAEGVPVTQVAAQLGHSRKSLTLDTHSHVLVG